MPGTVIKHRQSRPPLEAILTARAKIFQEDRGQWQRGRRINSGGRAVAAYVARATFGYGGREVARALGYGDGSSVTRAVGRVAQTPTGRRAAAKVTRRLAKLTKP